MGRGCSGLSAAVVVPEECMDGACSRRHRQERRKGAECVCMMMIMVVVSLFIIAGDSQAANLGDERGASRTCSSNKRTKLRLLLLSDYSVVFFFSLPLSLSLSLSRFLGEKRKRKRHHYYWNLTLALFGSCLSDLCLFGCSRCEQTYASKERERERNVCAGCNTPCLSVTAMTSAARARCHDTIVIAALSLFFTSSKSCPE